MEGAPRRTPHFVHKLVNGRPSITSPLKPVSLPSLLHVQIVPCFSGTVKREADDDFEQSKHGSRSIVFSDCS